MIYSAEKSVAIFLNPKTATTSLVTCLQSTGVLFDECLHNHTNYQEFNQKFFPDPGIKMFCLHRDPVDRFLSTWNYIRTRPGCIPDMIHYFYGDSIEMSFLDRTPFDQLSPEIQTALRNIKIIDFLKTNFAETAGVYWPLMKPQINWCNFDNVTLLPYRDIDNSIANIMASLDISSYTFTKENASIGLINDPTPTAEEISAIKEYYQVDYDFFQSAGILY